VKWVTPVAIVAFASCSAESPQIVESDTLTVADTAINWRTAELPPYPNYPGRRRGRLSARAVGVTEFDDAWRAQAVRCAARARLLLVAADDEGGVSMLLELPGADSLPGAYPVHAGDPRDAPQPPAADVGFQFFEEFGASAYQASAGTVQVNRLDERVSGSFQLEIEHIQTTERARVSGTFDGVRVDSAAAVRCARAGEDPDSADVVEGDS